MLSLKYKYTLKLFVHAIVYFENSVYSVYTETTNDFKLNLIAQRIFLEERLCLLYNKMFHFSCFQHISLLPDVLF